MKKIFKQLVLTLLSAMLLIGATVSVLGSNKAPEMSIDYCNLSFRDNVCIKYAVDSDSTEKTTVLIWDEPSDDYLYGTHKAELETVGNQDIEGNTYKIFDYTALSAKQMTDVIYARAYTVVDGVEYYSEVTKYSILQYAYSKLGYTAVASSDENLKNMLSSMLEYGADAQVYFEYNTNRLATDDFYQVKTSGGLIDDGCNHGLYLEGDEVTIIAPETNDEGIAFSHWRNEVGEVIANTPKTTITVQTANDVYFAEYRRISNGLEFDTNGDGTCCLVSIGDCTDTDIIIPRTSPDGETVTSIDSSAFAGEEITSVTIPTTIEEIGRKAFNGCNSLTDVYYEGSKEEWEILCDAIGTNNAPLLNANIHFGKVTYYTVTFVDYDGTELHTHVVASGEAAIAPDAPERAGYTFIGWDKTFDEVSEDITVTAQYEKNEVTYDGPTIVVESVTAGAGDTVDVIVSLAKNPGIMDMALSFTYDSTALALTRTSNGDALSDATFMGPKNMASGCRATWYYMDEPAEYADGSVIILTFDVLETAESGDYEVSVEYGEMDINDIEGNHLSFNIESGKVTVE